MTSPNNTAARPTIHEPTLERSGEVADLPVVTTAPELPVEHIQRQPSDLPPSVDTTAATEIGVSPAPTTTTPLNLGGPQKTTLTPKPIVSAAAPTTEHGQSPDRPTRVMTGEPAVNAKIAGRESPSAQNIADNAAEAPARQPAAAPTTPAAGTVAKPEFPTVNDDPFSPLLSPSPVPAATENHADDPFAPLPAPPATNDKPAEPLVTEPTLKKIDLLTPGADGRLPLRQWTDNSGKFSVRAQLVLILDGKVRLLKETGRTTTVAIERLSQDDRAYVAAAIERYGEDLAKLHQLAAR